jgi:hypothetical protein
MGGAGVRGWGLGTAAILIALFSFQPLTPNTHPLIMISKPACPCSFKPARNLPLVSFAVIGQSILQPCYSIGVDDVPGKCPSALTS